MLSSILFILSFLLHSPQGLRVKLSMNADLAAMGSDISKSLGRQYNPVKFTGGYGGGGGASVGVIVDDKGEEYFVKKGGYSGHYTHDTHYTHYTSLYTL